MGGTQNGCWQWQDIAVQTRLFFAPPPPSLALISLLNGMIPVTWSRGWAMHGGGVPCWGCGDITPPPGTLGTSLIGKEWNREEEEMQRGREC